VTGGALPASGREVTSTGLPPHVAAALAYLAWWVTGLLFLLLERRSAYVRFHALQAVIGLGAVWALGCACWLLSVPMAFVSARGFQTLIGMALVVWVAGVIPWTVCLRKAWHGERWKLPLAGALAARLVDDGW
jgi:uncharacterized membrane protein